MKRIFKICFILFLQVLQTFDEGKIAAGIERLRCHSNIQFAFY